MRVMVIQANSIIGGVEMITCNVLENLARDIETHVVITHVDGPLEPRLRSASNYYSSMTKRHYKVKHEIRDMVIQSILQFITANKVDLIHIVNSWEGFGVAEKCDVPVVYGLYADYNHPHSFFSIRVPLVMERLKRGHVHIITDTAANVYLFGPEHVTVCPTGVRCHDPGFPLNRYPKRVCWVGRWAGEKRPDAFIELARRMPDYEFIMVRAGRPQGPEERLPNIIIVQDITNHRAIQEIMLTSTFYVNTSKIEGMPLSLLEAMKCGCVPVVTRIGMMPEYAEGYGMVIPNSGEPFADADYKDLADRIRSFTGADHDEIRRRVAMHDVKGMANTFMEVWQSTLQE